MASLEVLGIGQVKPGELLLGLGEKDRQSRKSCRCARTVVAVSTMDWGLRGNVMPTLPESVPAELHSLSGTASSFSHRYTRHRYFMAQKQYV